MDMVAHCVHEQTAGPVGSMTSPRFGVFGVFFEVSSTDSDSFLAQFEDHLPATPSGTAADMVTSSFAGPMDFSQLFGSTPVTQYYSYNGSLTTPPCSEVVDWYVMMHPRKMSEAQLRKFQAAIGIQVGNYRPPQELNGRVIEGCRIVATSWYPYDAEAWANSVPGSSDICQDGHMQSPIDLPACTVPAVRPPLKLTWGKHEVILKNNGHTVQLDIVGTPGKLFNSDSEYKLLQCHFHWGSEHTIGGKQMDMVAHCVHQQTAGPPGSMATPRYGVLAFFYKLSETDGDAFLAQFEDSLPSNPSAGASSSDGHSRRLSTGVTVADFPHLVDFALMYGKTPISQYYTYNGSLTTPPCSEVVDWHLAMQPRNISLSQMRKFREAIGVSGGNFRPPQALNGRVIEGCSSEDAPWYPYASQAWATEVHGANPLCQAGHMQSPVDLPQCVVAESRRPMWATYGTDQVVLKNNGHTVQLDVAGTTGKLINGENEYTLLQCHFHSGSEHTIGGKQLDMVAHCVHQQTAPADMATQRFGVLALFFEVSDMDADPFLAQFVDELPANPAGSATVEYTGAHRLLSADVTTSAFTGPLDFSLLHNGASFTEYYSYNGSLTTPPCSEVVDWYLVMQPRKISVEQLSKFQKAIGITVGNFRPPQALNDRKIEGCSVALKPWYPYDPDAWAGSVQNSNAVCQEGQMQSPINLPACLMIASRPAIQLTWGKHEVALKNNGHTVQVDILSTPGRLISDGSEYKLLQCHFHWGSEHTVGGKQMDMVAHCVHQQLPGPTGISAGPRYAVLAFFYELSSIGSDPFLAQIEDHLPRNPSAHGSGGARRLPDFAGSSNFVDLVDFNLMYGNTPITQYYSYNGSLTTPPCSEVVDWYVAMQPRNISLSQMRKFRDAIGIPVGNFRPPQALNGRVVAGCSVERPEWYPYDPQAWASEVQGASEVCMNGRMQSPIDLPACGAPQRRAPLYIRWGQRNVVLKNNGHSVQLDIVGDPGEMTYGSSVYRLLQCHFHVGSEHTIGGKQLDMVAHCVHEQTAGPKGGAVGYSRYGVLAYFFEVSDTESDAFLAQFEDKLPGRPLGGAPGVRNSSAGVGSSSTSTPSGGGNRRLSSVAASISDFAGPVDFSLMHDNKALMEYYTYDGSLTTPPCSEIVDWYLGMQPRKISGAQLQKFKDAIQIDGGNYRPPQALHGRIIEGCEERTIAGAHRLQPLLKVLMSVAVLALVLV